MLECRSGAERPRRDTALGKDMGPENDTDGALRRRLAQGLRGAAALALAAVLWPAQAWAAPLLTVADVTGPENNDADPYFHFVVRLSEPAPPGGVHFDIATRDGTADSGDYASGMAVTDATIAEGEQAYAFDVPVFGDSDYEPDETFHVEVANVVGADIGDGEALGTILNDEILPVIRIHETSVIEGDSGDQVVPVEVTLDYPAPQEVRFDYRTLEWTAHAYEDFEPVSGTLVFAPGETRKTIDVIVHGDVDPERTESFEFETDNMVGGEFIDHGSVIIVSDDSSGFVLQPSSFPDGRMGVRYDAIFYVETSSTVYPPTFEIVSGSLPPGIQVTPSNGHMYLIGYPTTPGTYAFTLKATGRDGPGDVVSSRDYTITILGPDITLPATTLPPAAFAQTYSVALNPATGGTPPYHYTVTAGALPSGVTLGDSGTLVGDPRESGAYAFTVTVTDSSVGGPYAASRDFELQAQAPVISFEPNTWFGDGDQGQPYRASFRIVGEHTDPVTYAIAGGALPAGLHLSTDGVISGIPSEAGDFTFTMSLTDSTRSVPGVATDTLRLSILPSQVSFGPDTLPPAVVGTFFQRFFVGQGGVGPYSYRVVGGALPPGLVVEYGSVYGVPTTAGSYAFTVELTDEIGATYQRAYTLDVSVAPISHDPVVLPAVTAGRYYAESLSYRAHGGIAPYRYRLVPGTTLPAGMQFSEQDGTLSGTTTDIGRFDLLVDVTDSAPQPTTVRWSFDIRVVPPGLGIYGPDRLRAAAVGSVYVDNFQAGGGQAPYTFAITAGALPAGVTLRPDGFMSGTPTVAGSYAFTVTVTDSSASKGPFSAHSDYTLVVGDAVLTLEPGVLPVAREGAAYSATLRPAGGTAPYHTAITTGTLPPGLSLSDDGVISGVPGAPSAGSLPFSDYTFTIGLTDAQGHTLMRRTYITLMPAQTGTGAEALPIATVRTLDTQSGVEADTTLHAGGGVATGATLVSIAPATAGEARIERAGDDYRLRFLPSATFSGVAEVTYTLTNAAGTSAPATITFRVAARPAPLRDARVKRLLDLQARSARRFADAQMENFRQRLERLHDARESRGFANGLRANAAPVCVREVGAPPDRICARPPTARDDAEAPRAAAPDPLFALWTAGTLRSANQDGRSPGGAFETDGVSLGADYRVDGRFAFGAGVGYARDGDMIEDSDRIARSRGEALAFATYASWRPGAHGFVDMLAGWQRLAFDLRRGGAAEGAIARGRRDGLQRFASVSVGADYAHDRWRFAPYARYDLSRATLAGYAETGDALHALTYAPLAVDASSANAGLRIDYRRETRYGQFAPQLRVEYQRDLDAGAAQWLDYADLAIDPRYRSDLAGYDRSRWLFGFGLRFDAARRWSFGVDTRLVGGNGGWSDRSLLLRAEKRF